MILRIHGDIILTVVSADPRYRIGRQDGFAKNFQALLKRQFCISYESFLRTLAADLTHDFPRIKSRYPRNPELLHNLGKRGFASEIGWTVIVISDDESAYCRASRFIIVIIDPVVPDQRICHDHELICV